MSDPTPLEDALTEACAFAAAHGVEPIITPDDFGIHRSPGGYTHASYVDSDYVITVDIGLDGAATLGLAELSWVHFPDPEQDDDESCTTCHPDDGAPTHFRGVPLETVHLPGDAPETETTND